MERRLISKEELLSILNSELSKYEECKDCRFTLPLKLKEQDEDGCNWSSTIYLRCSGVPSEICRPFANKIVYEARKKYNII